MAITGRTNRKAERLPSSMFVDIMMEGSSQSLGRGIVLNMSTGGFLIETEVPMKKGNKYKCQVEIPLTFNAEVAWGEDKGRMKRVGLKLSDMGFFDKLLLKKALKGPRKSSRI